MVTLAYAGGQMPNYNTVAAVEAANVPAAKDFLSTAGYSDAGDGGAALYKRVVGEPSHAGKIQSGDGAWWELAETEVTLEMFGGVADGASGGSVWVGTDNSAAMAAALAYGLVNVTSTIYGATATIRLGSGAYLFSSPIKIKHNVRILGTGGVSMANDYTGSVLLFPTDTVGIYIFNNDSIDPDTSLAVGTTASGTLLENFMMLSATIGTDRTKHAIVMRARAQCNSLKLANFSGDGYNIVSNDSIGGQVNNWYINGGRVSGCQNGIKTAGADANAGVAVHVDTSGCRQAGILDRSFLGNQYLGCHCNGNGSFGQVSHGGNRYRVRPTVAHFDDPSPASTTEPGTDSSIWELIGAGGVASTYRAWVSGIEVVAAGQYVSTNSNARTTYVACYTESGFPASLIVYPAAALGGFHAAGFHSLTTGSFYQDSQWAYLRAVTSQKFTASENVSSIEGVEIVNEASLGTTRRTRQTHYIGVDGDGVRKPICAFTGRAASSSAADNGVAVIEYWDEDASAGAGAWATALDLNGETLAAAPGGDNTWSLGAFAFRWLKGWFGNISLFPGSSVTPANNGEVTFQLTSDTSLTFKVKGSDGVVRSGSIALS